MTLAAGESVADRFVVERLISEGGTAVVYRVRHTQLGVPYALKVMTGRSGLTADRLLREGRIQANLRHPGIVTVVDVVVVAGRPALLMEYVDGPTLGDAIAGERLPLETALAVFADLLAAVGAAHAAGVLHRDLKPQNVLLAPETGGWMPKVADFGIAKLRSEALGPGTTRIGVGMGTPGYTAPEQMRDAASVDAAADVYSLGALLYELTTGRLPFPYDPEAPREYVAAQELAPGLGSAASDAIAAALATEPAERPPTIVALAERVFADHPELRGIALGDQRPRPVTIPRLTTPTRATPALQETESGAGTIVPDAPQHTNVPGLMTPLPPEPKRPTRAWLGLAAGAVVGGLALLAVLPREPDGDPPVASVAGPVSPPATADGPPVDPSRAEFPAPADPIASALPDGAGRAAEPSAPPGTASASPAALAAEEVEATPAGASAAPASPTGSPTAAPSPSATAPPEAASPADGVVDAAPAGASPASPPPAATPAAPPAAAPSAPTGQWIGAAGGRPFRVTFQATDRGVEALVTLTQGITERTSRFRGVALDGGRVQLTEIDGDGAIAGTFDATTARGTLTLGRGKPLAWELAR